MKEILKTLDSWLSADFKFKTAPFIQDIGITQADILGLIERTKVQMNGSWRTLPPDAKTGKAKGYSAPTVGDKYPEQFYWDSAAHVIINACLGDSKHMDMAVIEMQTLMGEQLPDGNIAHQYFWGKQNKVNKAVYGSSHYSKITQPPLILHALKCLYDKGYKGEVIEQLPRVEKLIEYLDTRCNLTQMNLPVLIHPYECGMDALPSLDYSFSRFYPAGAKFNKLDIIGYSLATLINYRRVGFDLKKIIELKFKSMYVHAGFCSIYALGLADIANVYRQNNDEAAARKLEGKRDRLIIAMNEHMWSDELQMYVDIVHTGKQFEQIPVKTISGILPLITGALSHERAQKLVDHLLNKDEFYSSYPYPVVAMDERAFNPDDKPSIWRGSTWGIPNYLLTIGLLKYGFESEVHDLVSRFVHMVQVQNPHALYETYNPYTGLGERTPGFSWGCLALAAEQLLPKDSQ